jgi:arginyl-tRNA synthetase
MDSEVSLEAPNNVEFGDYATPAAIEEANKRGEVPREYAAKVVERLPTEEWDFLESVEVAGQGYINFHLHRNQLGRAVLDEIEDPGHTDKDEKVVIEHTSPNPNKPLHMGTMRCAILGDTIARIADYLGYDVEVQNYINDLGRQSATAIYAYKEFYDSLSEEEKDRKADYWVGVLYAQAAQYLEQNEDAEGDVEEIIRDIEAGDNENFDLMQEVVEKSLRGQIETAHRSNIFYDLIEFESDVVRSGLFQEAVEQLRDLKKVYEVTEGEDEGCIVIDMQDYEDVLGEMEKPYKILIRSNGTATYTAKDIALTLWKFGVIDSEFGYRTFGTHFDGEDYWATGGDLDLQFGDADSVINVIGRPQKFPMQVVESALRALGYEEQADNFSHLDFKFVYLTGDTLSEDTTDDKVAYSGRKGNWKGKHGDAVLDRTKELAREEIETRHDDTDPEEAERIAEAVSVAAVRYFLLRFSRKKDVDFSFSKVLDWEGDSGPYMLYSAARAHSILDGLEVEPECTVVSEEAEVKLLHQLDEFHEVVRQSYETQEPSKLTHYLRTLAEVFSTFYHKCHVQGAETEAAKKSRAALTWGFLTVMEEGLDLLGIDTVEEL